MSWMRSRGWASGGALLVLAATTLVAADTKKEVAKEKESASAGAADVTDLGTAFQLIGYGRMYKAPETLVTAAGLMLSVARAEMKDLDGDLEGKPVVEITEDGKPKTLDVPLKAAPGLDLTKEAAQLFDEADAMASTQKINLSPLIKAVKNRAAGSGPAGVVKRFARSVEPGQTHVLKMKASSDVGTDLAFCANNPLLVSVVRVDNNTTLASTLTGGGNIHFKPELGIKTRGVVIVPRPVVVVPRPVVVVPRPAVVIPRPVILTPPVRVIKRRFRTVGVGDCTILIRIHNPTKGEVPYALFVN